MSAERLYAKRHPWELEPYYSAHVTAMTAEELNSKTDIAAELATRDVEISRLRGQVDEISRELRQSDTFGQAAGKAIEIAKIAALLNDVALVDPVGEGDYADGAAESKVVQRVISRLTRERDKAQAALSDLIAEHGTDDIDDTCDTEEIVREWCMITGAKMYRKPAAQWACVEIPRKSRGRGRWRAARTVAATSWDGVAEQLCLI